MPIRRDPPPAPRPPPQPRQTPQSAYNGGFGSARNGGVGPSSHGKPDAIAKAGSWGYGDGKKKV